MRGDPSIKGLLVLQTSSDSTCNKFFNGCTVLKAENYS
jgi:hypothetical protein